MYATTATRTTALSYSEARPLCDQAKPDGFYRATCGGDVLDEGGDLLQFMRDQLDTWTELDNQNVVIWHHSSRGLRAIAVLYPDEKGRTQTRWM